MTSAQIRIPEMSGRTVAVLGLARSGLSAARTLMASGAAVWAWDDNPAKRDAAKAVGVPLVDLQSCDWLKPIALVLSPGIPHRFPKPHPVAALATARRCPIIGDIELMARARLGARFIGITGTNGKSTTTALTAHVLRAAGLHTEVGGNLGTPVLDLAPLGVDGIYVLELSSYQLELTNSLGFDVAVLLNITPDHLDRHGGMEGYVAAKARIFDHQSAPQVAIVGVDDEPSRTIHAQLLAAREQTVLPISAEGRIKGGVYAADGWLIDERSGQPERALELTQATNLPGKHNWQNAAAAFAACAAAGVPTAKIADGLKSYPGLAHRQELIGTIGDVRYVNDSKATNADATARALSSYRDIYWILGGQAKEGGVVSLAPWFDRVRHAFLIGEASELFARQLEGKLPYSRCGDLKSALDAAHERSQRETSGQNGRAIVLLSPACASWDQWRSYEHRGDAFRAMARALPGAQVLGRAA